MLCHHDRRMTKPEARRPLRPTGYDGMGPAAALPLLDRWRASTSSWRLASSPMALVTRPYRFPPRAASPWIRRFYVCAFETFETSHGL